MKIEISKYGTIISDQNVGNEVYTIIKSQLAKEEKCLVDLKDVKSMATFNAKQIFGRLYLELGGESFFNRIEIRNASEDLKIIIQLGIQSAIDDTE